MRVLTPASAGRSRSNPKGNRTPQAPGISGEPLPVGPRARARTTQPSKKTRRRNASLKATRQIGTSFSEVTPLSTPSCTKGKKLWVRGSRGQPIHPLPPGMAAADRCVQGCRERIAAISARLAASAAETEAPLVPCRSVSTISAGVCPANASVPAPAATSRGAPISKRAWTRAGSLCRTAACSGVSPSGSTAVQSTSSDHPRSSRSVRAPSPAGFAPSSGLKPLSVNMNSVIPSSSGVDAIGSRRPGPSIHQQARGWGRRNESVVQARINSGGDRLASRASGAMTPRIATASKPARRRALRRLESCG